MTKFLLVFVLSLFGGAASPLFAQQKSEKIPVSGECGMCKKKIETTAKSAGASYALWDQKSKQLTVKYNSKKTSVSKIEEAVANAGYDTQNYKGDDEAYKNLDECCKYERKDAKDSKPSRDPAKNSNH